MSNKIFENKGFFKGNTKSQLYATILLSISLILSYIENLFPFSVGGLGVRIGLANLVTIIALKTLSIRASFIINVLRIGIIGILFANSVRIMLSISGFILSFLLMLIMLKKLQFSIVTTSIFGGVAHNIAQILCLSILLKNVNIFVLMPFYIIIGIITGAVIGILSDIIYKKIILLHLNKV